MFTTQLILIPISVLQHYSISKQAKVPALKSADVDLYSYEHIKSNVKTHGITPMELCITGNKALLTNGNKRMRAAADLGLSKVPVLVTTFVGNSARIFMPDTLASFKPISEELSEYLRAMYLSVTQNS